MDPKPLWLLAELTYKCPLQCPYCSNPLDFAGPRFKRELSTEEWCRVFREAKALGVLQLGLSGGEPTLRGDLEVLVDEAHGLGLYTSLITSAYRLTKERLTGLKTAGLDHVQISIQGADAELSDAVAGTTSYRDKIAAYQYTRELGFPLTVNVVLHRRNLHQVEALIRLAESLGAERIELANTQFYGWALHNRDALMPTKDQLDDAWRVVQRERARLGTALEIVWVLPDYHEQYPKPCMGGWARAYMTVTPAGEVWPCHAAGRITTLTFDNVRDHPLDWIWEHSDAFTRFRGDAWMPEPCRSCPRKDEGFGDDQAGDDRRDDQDEQRGGDAREQRVRGGLVARCLDDGRQPHGEQPYAVEPDQHRERLDPREQGERTGEPVRGAAVARDLQGLHAIPLCPDRAADHVDRRGQGIDP